MITIPASTVVWRHVRFTVFFSACSLAWLLTALAPAFTNEVSSADAPRVPRNLTATAISDQQIAMEWSPATSRNAISGYAIFRDGTRIATTTATSYTDVAVQPGTECAYAVAAYDADGKLSGQTPLATATAPVNTIEVTADIQSAIAAAPEGSTVTIPAGVYLESVAVNKRVTLVGGPDVVIDGSGTRAHGLTIGAGAEGTLIYDIEFRHHATPNQQGAVSVDGVNDVTLRRLYSHHNNGANLHMGHGRGLRAEHCELSYAAQQGYHVDSVASGGIFGGRIHHNHTDLTIDAGWEAGGGKVWSSQGFVFDSVEVDHNAGAGIWYDTNKVGPGNEIRHNHVHDNSFAGIFFEVSDGVKIYNNIVRQNGWGGGGWGWPAGILVSSASNAVIYDNVVAWNNVGISVLSQNRPDAPVPISGNFVHDNLIISSTFHTSDVAGVLLLGFYQDWGGTIFKDGSNRGSANRFYVTAEEPAGGARFAFNGPITTLDAFNATAGGGGNSRYVTHGIAMRATR